MNIRHTLLVAGFLAAGCSTPELITFEEITLNQALANADGKLVMVDFITDN